MAKKGHIVSEETRRKISNSAKGKTPSIETRRKQSAATKGRPKSVETKAKMKQYHANRTPEHNKNISKGLTGKKVSPEHIANQRKTKLANGTWKPVGYTFERQGYRYIKISFGRGRDNHVLEHRHVAEKMIGRSLLCREHVHHLDGNSLNNSPQNLCVISAADHSHLNRLLRCIDDNLAHIIINTLTIRFQNLG